MKEIDTITVTSSTEGLDIQRIDAELKALNRRDDTGKQELRPGRGILNKAAPGGGKPSRH